MTHLSRILTFFSLFLAVFAAESQGYYNAADAKVYELIPEEYGIVQGDVDSATALANRYAIEEAMAYAKDNRYKTLRLSNFDAFFEITHITSTTNPNFYPFEEGINTVSGLNLDFRDNATFRIFPNKAGSHTLVSTVYSKNVTLMGGTFVGDRLTHDESEGGDQRGHCISITAGTNILVDGTDTKEAYGDGMKVNSRYQTWHPDYSPSNNVIIRNSTQSDNRRQGISITDGYKIIIENCRGIDNGRTLGNSSGSLPKCWIDIEGQRTANPDGSLRLDEYAHDIIIRDNYERGSANASILVHIGDDVIVENNDVENGIVVDYASQIRILNNRIVAKGPYGVGVNIARENRSTFDNLVQGNYIANSALGINLGGNGARIIDNEVYNTPTGLKVKNARNALVEGNTFDSDVLNSTGAYFHVTTSDSVILRNNTFKADRDALAFVSANNGIPSNRTYIYDNIFKGNRSFISNSAGLVFERNTFDNGMRITNSEEIVFRDQNKINSTGPYSINLGDGNNYITINDNIFNANGNPVQIDAYPSIFEYARNILNGDPQAQ